ncbi:IS200/IS605 family transposase [Chlorobium sp. BLA1]|uniref:IS200/IS605 family transposase n=1 Tax=Candidatus Chlorobium masyuteum TaxID=2716876 RepID=UPI001420AF34|nr:IS200/IS605 family transposase [Candidatus Chlorobium masyuteum]NHQ59403.1 IS200/IS605 family transposase [Candidatus Chlorobium masyuteum]NTU45720.1 IS200/IS605 family transposase [Chlorobiaceae bacterium]
MANSYTQIHIQAVFAVKRREHLLHDVLRDELCRYLTGIIQQNGHKVLAINGMPDHLHVLFGMRPNQSLSELMKEVKAHSAKWINENQKVHGHFEWQEGYGAFSYERSALPNVISYIMNQKDHHNVKTFMEEYRELLKDFEVSFDEKYLFHVPQ